jgi:3-oxoacyl-[acyl-carrier-protein] synthase III
MTSTNIAANTRRPASYVAGTGMSVPPRIVSNEHFATYLETSDEWIRERTGIAERRWAAPEIAMSDLALPACRDAITAAGLATEDIDCIICATVTPDYIFPSTACILQRKLGVPKGFAFDVNAVCSGFLYAFTLADSLIASGQCKNCLVIGADMYSRILDPNDRTTVVIFGDGAGAVVLRATEGNSERGVLCTELHSNGTGADLLYVSCGTAKQPTPESLARGEHYLHMNGREVFKVAVRGLVEVSESVLARSGVKKSDVHCVVSHQANKRILTSVAKQMEIPEEKMLMNVERYGNTSAASIPIMLAEAVANRQIVPGKLILLSAFGGGLTWGAALVRW